MVARVLFVCLLTSLFVTETVSPAAKNAPASRPAPPPPASVRSAEVTVAGKLHCNLKRLVSMQFPGVILSLNVKAGQRVKEGDVLGKFRLAPDHALALHRRVSPTVFKDLELQMAGIDKNLDQLQSKQRELRLLAQQNMATTESVEQVNREIQFYTRQRTLLQDRMAQEKAYAQEDLNVLRHHLGPGVNPGQVPKEVPLMSPISGHALWVNPDVRQGSELGAGTPLAWLADMDPMRVRAQVHEIEAMQLRLGEVAEMTLESVPGRKFQAKVVSIPWTSSSPAPDQPSYFEVELEVSNPDFVLREGLKGMITFPAQR